MFGVPSFLLVNMNELIFFLIGAIVGAAVMNHVWNMYFRTASDEAIRALMEHVKQVDEDSYNDIFNQVYGSGI